MGQLFEYDAQNPACTPFAPRRRAAQAWLARSRAPRPQANGRTNGGAWCQNRAASQLRLHQSFWRLFLWRSPTGTCVNAMAGPASGSMAIRASLKTRVFANRRASGNTITSWLWALHFAIFTAIWPIASLPSYSVFASWACPELAYTFGLRSGASNCKGGAGLDVLGRARGTFALRSPMRPNPIAVSIVSVVAIEEDAILVRGWIASTARRCWMSSLRRRVGSGSGGGQGRHLKPAPAASRTGTDARARSQQLQGLRVFSRAYRHNRTEQFTPLIEHFELQRYPVARLDIQGGGRKYLGLARGQVDMPPPDVSSPCSPGSRA